MTGVLTLNANTNNKSTVRTLGNTGQYNQLMWYLSDSLTRTAMVTPNRGSDRDILQILTRRVKTDGSAIGESKIELHALDDGTTYATAPSWSPGTNDNSDKILTIKMANSLPSLVHTTGNETVAGTKTFTSRIVEQKSTDMGMEMLSTSFDRSVTFTSYQRPVQFIARDKNGESVLLLQTYAESNNRRGLDLTMYDGGGNAVTLALKSDGTKIYATAPTTPSNATGTEIATANWVLARINELAAKNGLNGL